MDGQKAVRDVVARHWSLLICPTQQMAYQDFVLDPAS